MRQRGDAQLPVELVEEDLVRALEIHEAIHAGVDRLLALGRSAVLVPPPTSGSRLERTSSVA